MEHQLAIIAKCNFCVLKFWKGKFGGETSRLPDKAKWRGCARNERMLRENLHGSASFRHPTQTKPEKGRFQGESDKPWRWRAIWEELFSGQMRFWMNGSILGGLYCG